MPACLRHLRRFGLVLTLGLALFFPFRSEAATQENGSRTVNRYRAALQIDPDNPVLQYALGVALLQEGDINSAIAALRKAYPAYNDSIEMHYNMGLAFTLLGDPDSALLYLDQAETLSGRQGSAVYPLTNALYNVALLYLEKDALDESADLLKKILLIDPQRVEIYRILGDIAARKGQDAEAVTYMTAYLEHYPDDPSAREYLYALHFNRAIAARDADDAAVARQEFKAALALIPESPPIYYYLGEFDYRHGAKLEATPQLVRAFPDLPEELRNNARAMLYNCALDALNLHKTDEALAAVTPLLQVDTPRVKDLLLAGDIHLRRKEYLVARNVYSRVLEIEPGNPQASINLTAAENGAIDTLFADGIAHFKAGECQQALPLFADILSIRPKDHRALSFRDKCLDQNRQTAKQALDNATRALAAENLRDAMTSVQRGLTLDPDNSRGVTMKQQILERLDGILATMLSSGKALLTQQDFAAAEAQFRKVLELSPDNTPAQEGLARARQLREQAANDAVDAGNLALDEGRLTAARDSFDRAAALLPDMSDATDGLARLDALLSTMFTQEVQWGRAARAAGQLDQARSHFSKALELKESKAMRRELAEIDAARAAESSALLKSARSARKKGNYKAARHQYEQALASGAASATNELTAMDSEISRLIEQHLTSAAANTASGKQREAVADYRKVLELAPDNPTAINGLQAGRNQLQAAIATVMAKGKDAMAAGDLKQARQVFEQALDMDPYQAEAQSALEHIASLEQRGVKPGDEQRLYLRGIELYTRGRYTEAVEAWEQVLRIAPGHEKARMNIDKARRKLQSIREFQGG